MTERYSFTVDRHLVPNIAIDGSVIWSQDNMDSINSSLADSINEGYATAEEDTQYLSVLDSTNEISLENLNLTMANPKLEVEETAETFITSDDLIEQTSEEAVEQQVVVYTMEGSDELYGIQIAQDEEGNLQKYQFQFRKNKDGQLEAIPETIQLLPMEEVIQDEQTIENLEQEETIIEKMGNEHHLQIFVHEDNSSEHILPDNSLEEQEETEEQDDSTVLYEHENIEEETVDIKPGILTMQNVKQEIQEHQVEFDPDESMEEETTESFSENLEQENVTDFHRSDEDMHEESDEQHIIEYNEHLDQNSVVSEENSNLSEPLTNGMRIEYTEKIADTETDYMKETHLVENITGENFEHVEVNPDMEIIQTEENIAESQEELEEFSNEHENNMNDSDADDYQIVEGVHVTGDVDTVNNVSAEPMATAEKPLPNTINNTNILRHALKTNKELKIKRDNKDNRLYLYVVQHPEKENVDSLSLDMSNLCKPIKANPRSILKSSHPMFPAKNENESFQPPEERLSKRFARCKEAMQARIFHNFINKTTIPQAPVRKNRLPRKQKIKPVERTDEEIVVQEVMVSSTGVMEAVGEGFNKENLEVTEYVELTDSDDDYDPKKVNKKKKKHKKKRIEIISDDSDVSHDSIIELDESDDDTVQRKEQEPSKSPKNEDLGSNSPTKRRRGRPPKNRKLNQSESQTKSETESPQKKIRVESSENLEKPEIPCPKCDKTFPSQNSLKTHLQHHSLQSSLRNALPEYKYKCEDCGSTFKNNILLKRHVCPKNLTCSVCKKKFPNESSLAAHKRIHAKEQLIKSTTIAQVSPKKTKPVFAADSFKSPKKMNNLKCKTCGKLCSSMQNLNVHVKTHREYVCTTCSAKFVSQLMLEKHVRESCVKSPKGNRRSLRIRSTGAESSAPLVAPTVKLANTHPEVSCDKCSMRFLTHKALFKHKVLKHGLETPDKSVQKNDTNKLHKDTSVSGVPATSKLKNAYSDLRCQLDFTE